MAVLVKIQCPAKSVKFENQQHIFSEVPLSLLHKPTHSRRMTDHLVIQVDFEYSAEPIPCVVCLIRSETPTQAIPGFIRCKNHYMNCSTCGGFVNHDSNLCCSSCWRRGLVPSTEKLLASEKTLCQKKGCSCTMCKKKTIATLEAKAMEEGEAQTLSPPTTPERETHIALSFGFS